MKVVEIFKSIDGEGIRAGYPVTFIRLAGCNLRCTYCDTSYSYSLSDATDMTVQDILDKVNELNCKRITLTGGEPLIHENVHELIDKLTSNDYEVNIETNGSVDISDYVDNDKIIITADYKCKISGMEDKMLLSNLSMLRNTDVLKFVVGSKDDLETVLSLKDSTKANIFISPVFGMIQASDIVDFILENNMNDCRVQLQLHKYIWNPNKRGV